MKLNKAEKFIEKVWCESRYNGMPEYNSDLITEVYFAICKKLNNPDHWPIEYKEAFDKFQMLL